MATRMPLLRSFWSIGDTLIYKHVTPDGFYRGFSLESDAMQCSPRFYLGPMMEASLRIEILRFAQNDKFVSCHSEGAKRLKNLGEHEQKSKDIIETC